MIIEYDNLRATLDFCLFRGARRAALELAGSLWFFWYHCGFPREGQHYLERALAANPEPSRTRNHGRPQAAQTYGRAALKIKHRMCHGMGTALALDALTLAAAAIGRADRAARLLGLAQQVWDTVGRAQAGVSPWVAARQACEKQTRNALGDLAYETAYRAGYTVSLDSGVAHALGHT
jgi:hypothetical protein